MKKLLVSLFVVFAIIITANAQSSTGTLTGTVTDSAGAVVPGANVQVNNLETNAVVTLTTGDEGNFAASSLLPGIYQLTVEKQGFRKTVLRSITVQTAQTATVNVTLEVGAETETVEVRDEAPLLNPDSPTLATTIETKLVEDLPFTDRSALGAVTLAAGVTGDPQYPNGIQSENPGIFTAAITPGGSLQVSGSRPGTSSILVDGSDITLASFPRTGVTFSGETMREVTIQQNGLPAQYGRTGGGIINQSTRGGGNRYYASAQWQHTDGTLQARTFGSPTDPARRQDLYSFVGSGPVILPAFGEGGPTIYNGKDRTFFFASYEPTRVNDVVFNRGRLPTPDELAGRFNNSLEVLNQSILRTQGIEAALAAARTGGIAYRFARNAQGFPIGLQLPGAQAAAVPNNDLSAQLALNPTARYLLSFFPTPQNPGAYTIFYRPDGLYDRDGTNAFLARGVQNEDNRFNIRVDHRLTKNDQLAVRFTYVPVEGIRFNFVGPESPAEAIFTDRIKSFNTTATEIHTFGGGAVNEFRLTYTNVDSRRVPINVSLDQDYGRVSGILPANLPAVLGVGFPAIGNTIQQIGTQQTNGPGKTQDINLGIANDFSFIRGNHNLRIGGEARFLQTNRLNTAGLYGGSFGFTPGLTANPTRGNTGIGLATFILGSISSYSYTPDPYEYKYRYKYFATYIQDDWKIRRNLTLNLGLRYNLEIPRTEENNRQGTFLPDLTGTVNGVAVRGGFSYSGENGLGETLFPISYKGFEPRVGFAYQPFDSMTLRASYTLVHTALTGLGNTLTPDLSQAFDNYAGGNGGVSATNYANYITNPLRPAQRVLPTSGTLFEFPTGSNIPYIPQNSDVPYVQLFSASLQYQIGRNAVVEAAYSGQKATNLFSTSLNYNIPDPNVILAQIRNNSSFLNTVASPIFPGVRTTFYESLRPFPQFYNNAIDSAYERRASSNYHALYLTFRQRLVRGITTTASYSFSKSIDDFSSGNPDTSQAAVVDSFAPARTQNPFDLKNERSVSTFDIPHRFSLGFTADAPVGKNKLLDFKNDVLNNIFGNISFSGIFNRQSGYPIQLYLGSFNGTNASNVNGFFCGTAAPTVAVPNPPACALGNAVQDYFIRPNIVPGVPLINPNWDKNNPLAQPYLNAVAFSVPGSLRNPEFGNAPRTLPYLRTPTTQQFDLTGRKRFRLFNSDSRHFVELRADVLNVLNRRNLIYGTLGNSRSLFTGISNGNFLPAAGFGFLGQSDALRGRTLRLSARIAF